MFLYEPEYEKQLDKLSKKAVCDRGFSRPISIKDIEQTELTRYDAKNKLINYVDGLSLERLGLGHRSRAAVKTPEALFERQEEVREAFLNAIGGLPEDAPLDPEIKGIIKCKDHHIEKIIFQTRMHNYVTANLYVPDSVTKPAPAVLFVCGHGIKSKQRIMYQAVCQRLVQKGFVVLSTDMIGQGERFSYYDNETGMLLVGDGTTEHEYAGIQALPLGYSIAKYIAHDAVRSLDYLLSRKEVDPDRIGVTGNSCGGLQTSMMMILDKRITAAAPATYITSREAMIQSGISQDCEQIWNGFSQNGLDYEDILFAFAPKPLMILACTHDFFPVGGTRETVKSAKRYWELLGKEHFFRYFEDVSGHMYTDTMAKACADFFSMVFAPGETHTCSNDELEFVDFHDLLCCKNGQISEEKKDSRFIYDENKDLASAFSKRRKATPSDELKENARVWLTEKVYANRRKTDADIRIYDELTYLDLSVTCYIWFTQKAMINCAMELRNTADKNKKLPATLALWNGGTSCLEQHFDFIRKTCSERRSVIVLSVSGVAPIDPYPYNVGEDGLYGTIYRLSTDMILLGDSIAALRAYDVLKAIDIVASLDNIDAQDFNIYSYGTFSAYAVVAAFLDERVKTLTTGGEEFTYDGWVNKKLYHEQDMISKCLPGILKYCDLDDLYNWVQQR